MLDDSDCFPQSVDQGPVCLIIVLCPQLKLSTEWGSVWTRREAAVPPLAPLAATRRRCRAVRADPEAGGATRPQGGGSPRGRRRRLPPLSSRDPSAGSCPGPGSGWLLPTDGPRPAEVRSRCCDRSWRRRPPSLGEAASRKASGGGPSGPGGPGSPGGWETSMLLPLSLSGKDARFCAPENRWRAPRH